MTETYNGPWDSILGDYKPKKQVPDDPYHPRYADTNGATKPGYSQPVKTKPEVVQPKQA